MWKVPRHSYFLSYLVRLQVREGFGDSEAGRRFEFEKMMVFCFCDVCVSTECCTACLAYCPAYLKKAKLEKSGGMIPSLRLGTWPP